MTESRVRRPGKLGFGLMRLPKKGFSIDIGETCEMVDRFLQADLTILIRHCSIPVLSRR